MIDSRSQRIRQAVFSLRRRSGAGLLFFVLVVGVVGVGSFVVPPVYRAETTLLVEGHDPAVELARMSAVEAAFSSAGGGGERSVNVADATRSDAPRIARNRLGSLASREALEAWIEAESIEAWPEFEGLSRERILELLRERIRIAGDADRDLVRVTLEGRDPERVAEALDALARQFVEREAAAAPMDTAAWEDLTREERRIAADLDACEKRLDELTTDRGAWRLEAELGEQEASLATLRDAAFASREAVEAIERRLAAVETSREQGDPLEIRLGLLEDRARLDRLAELRAVQSEHEADRERLLERRGYRLSDLKAIEKGLAATNGRIEGLEAEALMLLDRRLGSARLEAKRAKKRFDVADDRANMLRDQLERVNGAVDRRQALREARDDLRDRKAEAWLAHAAAPSGVRAEIVDAAGTPTRPVRPQPIRNLVIALVAGILGGTILVFVLELLDDSIKGNRDIRSVLRVPSLGMIPRLGGRNASERVKLITVEQPASDVSEAFRGICSGMSRLHAVQSDAGLARGGSRVGGGARSGGRSSRSSGLRAVPADQLIVVTSAGRREGKTTTASNLAVAMAQEGHETLLIDANMRDPNVHRIFHTVNDRGLSSVVAAGESLEACIRKSGVPNLSVLPSGPVPLNPSEIFMEDEIERTFETLRRTYDRIVVDAPSILCGNDVVVLGRLADSTLMVVGAYQTSREEAVAGKEYLTGLGVRVAGAVLNRSRTRRRPMLETPEFPEPVAN